MVSQDVNQHRIADLQSLWSSHDSSKGLNQRLRSGLRSFAKEAKCAFQQDNAGNIYVLKKGVDSSLSSIALAFPLDSASPSQSFESAIRTFLQLQSTKTTTDIILLGLTSPKDSRIGYYIWEGSESASELHDKYPELKEFANNLEPEECAISALIEIEETEQSPVLVTGSPLLADPARASINVKVDVSAGGEPHSSRCAAAKLQGKGAVSVGVAVAVAYGDYVKKLFDNFD